MGLGGGTGKHRSPSSPWTMRLAGAVVALLAVAAALVWIVPGALDWNAYRGLIARFASQQLGRQVRIDGRVSVVLLPSPVLSAEDVRVANGGDGISVSAATLRLRLAFGPLLLGHVVPRDLVLGGASIALPWPLPGAARLDAAGGLGIRAATLVRSRLTVGGLRLTHLDATLAPGREVAGSLAIEGTATVFGRRWRFSDRLDPADGAGGTPITLTARAIAPGEVATASDELAGSFGGTVRADGSLSGHLSAHAGDLATVLPAPALPASLDGTLTLGRGPVRGVLAVRLGADGGTLRLGAAADGRQTAALEAGRIDLDAWRKVRRPALPAAALDLEVAAEAVTLEGATLLGVRAAGVVERGGVTLRSLGVTLPDEARLTLGGRIELEPRVGFAGRFKLEAPQLRPLLGFLVADGVRLGMALPPEVLRSATLGGRMTADAGRVELDEVAGRIDQTAVGGRIGLDRASGAVDASLAVDRVDLDGWLPEGWPSWKAVSGDLRKTTLALKLRAATVGLLGQTAHGVVLDAATDAGGVAVNGLDFEVAGARGHAAGAIDADGAVNGAVLDLTAADARTLAAVVPGGGGAVWSGPLHLHLEATGPRASLLTTVTLDLADARLEAHPTLDLADGSWSTQLTLRHPGATRLLTTLGWAGARGWLGEGSLSLLARVAGGRGAVEVSSYDLTAGTLHATGGLKLALPAAGVPVLSGRVDADTLPLPVVGLRDASPAPLGVLAGWDGRLALHAATVAEGAATLLTDATASLGLAGGVATIEGLRAGVAGGGRVVGSARLDLTATPPVLRVDGRLTGAEGGSRLFGSRPDLSGGTYDVRVSVSGGGYSPETVLGSLSGEIEVTGRDGVLTGLSPGGTGFDELHGVAVLSAGLATLRDATLKTPTGEVSFTGTIDLPDNHADLNERGLGLQAPAGPPRAGAGLPTSP